MPEIQQYSKEAKSLMLQLYCGKNFTLEIEDVNKLLTFMDALNNNVQFIWGIENTASTEFHVQIGIFVVM